MELQRRLALLMVCMSESRWVASMERWEEKHAWWAAALVALIIAAVMPIILKLFGYPRVVAAFLTVLLSLVLFVFYGWQVRSGLARQSRAVGRAIWRSLAGLPPQDPADAADGSPDEVDHGAGGRGRGRSRLRARPRAYKRSVRG